MPAIRCLLIVIAFGLVLLAAAQAQEQGQRKLPDVATLGLPAPWFPYELEKKDRERGGGGGGRRGGGRTGGEDRNRGGDEEQQEDEEEELDWLDRQQGYLVLFFIFRTDSADLQDALKTMADIKRKYEPKGVKILGMTPEKKARWDAFAKDHKVEFDVISEFAWENAYPAPMYPTLYMIDPHRILVQRFSPDSFFEDRLEAQLQLTPPLAGDQRALQNLLMKATTAARKEEYGRAYTIGTAVSRLVERGGAMAGQAEQLVKQAEEGAKKLIERAQDARKKQEYDKAIAILVDLSIRMKRTELGREADNELGRLLGSRDLKAKISDEVNNVRGRMLNDQADDAEAAGRYIEALHFYRETIDKYKDTLAGKDAAAAVERIEQNPRAQQALKDERSARQAGRWLDIADRLALIEMYSEAQALYQRVVEEHPNTWAAGRARQRLSSLPKVPKPDTSAEAEKQG